MLRRKVEKKKLVVIIDSKNSHDKIDWKGPGGIFNSGVHGRLLSVFKSFYSGNTACVRKTGDKSKWFELM